jgi:hypothetical protein
MKRHEYGKEMTPAIKSVCEYQFGMVAVSVGIGLLASENEAEA